MKSLEELAAIRDKMKQTVNTREAAHDSTRVVVGMATCGIAAGARPVLNAFTEEVARRDRLHRHLPVRAGGGDHLPRPGKGHLCKNDARESRARRVRASCGRASRHRVHHRQRTVRRRSNV